MAALLAPRDVLRYRNGMKRQAVKSSITLPPDEFRLVTDLKTRLRLKSNVEVVRKGLHLLRETTDRDAIKAAYRRASRATRAATREAIDQLDHLSSEGLD
jgi:Arc/MetJ-type ribon-helix-helix transcriptional regulator